MIGGLDGTGSGAARHVLRLQDGRGLPVQGAAAPQEEADERRGQRQELDDHARSRDHPLPGPLPLGCFIAIDESDVFHEHWVFLFFWPGADSGHRGAGAHGPGQGHGGALLVGADPFEEPAAPPLREGLPPLQQVRPQLTRGTVPVESLETGRFSSVIRWQIEIESDEWTFILVQ